MNNDNVSVGDLLTIEGKKYITLELLNYENNDYLFVNEMTDEEEVTEDFYIFKLFYDGSIRIVTEERLKQVLIPKFQELLKNDIRDL